MGHPSSVRLSSLTPVTTLAATMLTIANTLQLSQLIPLLLRTLLRYGRCIPDTTHATKLLTKPLQLLLSLPLLQCYCVCMPTTPSSTLQRLPSLLSLSLQRLEAYDTHLARFRPEYTSAPYGQAQQFGGAMIRCEEVHMLRWSACQQFRLLHIRLRMYGVTLPFKPDPSSALNAIAC